MSIDYIYEKILLAKCTEKSTKQVIYSLLKLYLIFLLGKKKSITKDMIKITPLIVCWWYKISNVFKTNGIFLKAHA